MYTLLIVDDEEIEREGMARLIPWEKYGYKLVGTAQNGAEGLEKVDRLHPDIAIVDIKMPVMNGVEMIRRAREAYPDRKSTRLNSSHIGSSRMPSSA